MHVSCPASLGEEGGRFQDYFKDPFVLMDDSNLVIWNRAIAKVYIYDKKNFKKISEFGEKGVGPGQFQGISKVTLKEGNIFVSNFPKVSVFSMKGKLLREIKGPSDAGAFVPFGDSFVGRIHPPTARRSKKAGSFLLSIIRIWKR